MKKLTDHYPQQPRPIGVGTFLRRHGELYIVAQSEKPYADGRTGIGLVSLANGAPLNTSRTRTPHSLTEGEVIELCGDFDGWATLSVVEVGHELGNIPPF